MGSRRLDGRNGMACHRLGIVLDVRHASPPATEGIPRAAGATVIRRKRGPADERFAGIPEATNQPFHGTCE